jgi:hypothetical protein
MTGAALRAVFSSAAYTAVALNDAAPTSVRIASAALAPLHAYGVAETAFPDKLAQFKKWVAERCRRGAKPVQPR